MGYKSGEPSIIDDVDFKKSVKKLAKKHAKSVYEDLKKANVEDIKEFSEKSFVIGFCLGSAVMLDTFEIKEF